MGGCGPGYDTTGVLSYVGAGGDYKQETTYSYVGQGAGDFEMVPVPTNFRPNWWVCIIPMLLLVLLVPFLLYLLPQLSSEPVTTTMGPMPIPAPAPPMPTRPPYVPPAPRPPAPAPRPPPAPPAPPADPNCAVGSPMQWEQRKKVWCCLHHHLGCPPTPPPAPIFRPPPPPPVVQPITTSCPYDCNAGFSNWAKGWPIGKKT